MLTSFPIRVAPEFQWPVAKAGYSMVEVVIPALYRSENGYELIWSDHGEQSELIGRRHGDRLVLSNAANGYEDRTPFDDSAVFMNLAQLECREDQVLEFASRYGTLQLDWQ